MTDDALTGDDQGLQFVVDDVSRWTTGRRIPRRFDSRCYSCADPAQHRTAWVPDRRRLVVNPRIDCAAGQRVVLRLAAPKPSGPQPEEIALDVLYEDDGDRRRQSSLPAWSCTRRAAIGRERWLVLRRIGSARFRRPAARTGPASCIGSTAIPAE